MKKLIALLLLTSVVFAVSGCGSSGPAEEAAPAIDKAKDAKVEKGGAEATPTQD